MKLLKRTALVFVSLIALLTIWLVWDDMSAARDVTEQMRNSPQYNGEQFLNPGANSKFGFGQGLKIAWQFMTVDNERKPNGVLPQQDVDLGHFVTESDDHLSASWVGHSSLMINIDGVRILTDPVYEKKLSILGPTRFSGEIPLDVDSLQEIDIVLISHDHYDHLNKFTIRKIEQKTKRFFVPLGVAKIINDWGVPDSKIIEVDWWQETKLTENLTIVSTPVQHFSGRGVVGRNRTLWTSYVVKSKNHRIFFSGDSGYFEGFKRIGEKYGPFDITFMECGAYNEQWKEIHMMPEETVQAHLDLNGKVLHPIHWGTFDLALHAWYDPMQRATKAANQHGVTIATPITGETTIYGEHVPDTRWWEEVIEPET